MSRKVKDIVSWVMDDEQILKLQKENKTYYIDNSVFGFMKSKGLLDEEEYEVEVEIDDDKKPDDTDGTVVRLATSVNKQEETAPKETAEEKPKECDKGTVKKELTVGGVSVAKKTVIFKEEDGVWYNVGDGIDVEEFKKAMTKKKGQFVIEITDKGYDNVVSFVPCETPKEQAKEQQSKKSSYETNTQKSIEAQVAVEHAQILAGALFANANDWKEENIHSFIEDRAKRNYTLIQELKNNEHCKF